MARRDSADGYLIGEAVKLTGNTANQLRYLERVGLVRPSIAAPPRRARARRGRPIGSVDRVYSRDDLLVAVLVAQMREAGLSLQRLRKAVAKLREWCGPEPLQAALRGEVTLLVTAKRVYIADSPGAALDVLRQDGQAVFTLALDTQAQTTAQLIDSYQRKRAHRRRLHEALVLAQLTASRRQVRNREALDAAREALAAER